MSKAQGAPEKAKEGANADAKSGEGKKAEGSASSGGKKGHNPMPGGCFCWGCKAQATRFNFCPEHFEHFKFGLIKKTGEPVSDYERKFEHFALFKKKQSVPKVA